ncbi:hypothetical protein HY497_01585 [Candidatus Woesearchaeota archaeon]|nr:hypothetical protein [Candidatus Woesearchaeota archaeon]
MSQKNLIVNGLEFSYKGVFRFDEFYDVLGRSFEERGYKRHEKRFEEFNTEQGKDLFIELRPTKVKAVYLAQMIKVRIEMKHVRDITLDVDGVLSPFQEGEIYLLFDAWANMRYNQKWNMHPWFYFVKAVIHKYVYQFPLEGNIGGEVASDAHYALQKIKAYLNLYKYRVNQAEEKGY